MNLVPLLVASCLSVVSCCAVSAEAPDEMPATFRRLVETDLAAQNNNDVTQQLSVIHPDSRDVGSIKEFERFRASQPTNTNALVLPRFRRSLKSFAVLGADSDYTIARAVQERELVGPMKPPLPHWPYRQAKFDTLVIFRQSQAGWRIWKTVVLTEAAIQNAAPEPGAAEVRPPAPGVRP